MKKSLTVLFCLLICWATASGALAKGFNQDTQKAQKQLSSLGYSPGPADGMMGENTRKAIKKFQKDKGLKVTGSLNNNTLDLLLNQNSNTGRPAGNSNTSGQKKTQKQDSKKQDSKKQDSKGQGHQNSGSGQGHNNTSQTKQPSRDQHQP